MPARPTNARQLSQRGKLPVGLQDTEQEGGDDGVEMAVWKRGFQNVRFQQLGVLAKLVAPLPRPGQHAGAHVDPHDPGAFGIERYVAAGSDAGIQYESGNAVEHLGSQRPVAEILEPEVKQIV